MTWLLPLFFLLAITGDSDDSEASTALRRALVDLVGEEVAAESAENHEAVRVEVAWSFDHSAAHVVVEAGGVHEERDVSFAPTDAPSERGRAVAFVIVAALPAPLSVIAPTTVERSAEATLARSTSSRSPAFVLGASAFVVAGVDKEASTGVGGVVHAGWVFAPDFVALLAADARAGSTLGDGASLWWASVRAGLLWTFARFSGLELSLVGTLGVASENVSFVSGDGDGDDTASSSAWLGVAAVMAEVAWRPVPSFALVGGVGGELATARTRVYVDDESRGTLGPGRFRFEMGFRLWL